MESQCFYENVQSVIVKKSSYIKQRKARVLSFGDILHFKGIAIVITTS